jgi:hypothetical protein
VTEEQKERAERIWKFMCVTLFLVGVAMVLVSVYLLAGWHWGILATGATLMVSAKALI